MNASQITSNGSELQTLKRKDVAKILCISLETVKRLISERKIKGFKVTGRRDIRVLKSSLENYINSMTR